MAHDKKVALITGANRGIGLETAKQLGAQGIAVLVASRKLSDSEAAVTKLKAEGVEAYPIQLDVGNAEDRSAAVKYVTENFGKLDILINNAGVLKTEKTASIETPAANLEATFATNLFHTVAVTQDFLPLLRKSDAARIVNLSSILGSLTLHADPKSPIASFKNFAYDASKSALNAFTIHLAYDLKDTPIKVNSAHPGWVKTEMGGEGAQMEIPDGAKTSVALALLGPEGPSGRFIHMGQELPW